MTSPSFRTCLQRKFFISYLNNKNILKDTIPDKNHPQKHSQNEILPIGHRPRTPAHADSFMELANVRSLVWEYINRAQKLHKVKCDEVERGHSIVSLIESGFSSLCRFSSFLLCWHTCLAFTHASNMDFWSNEWQIVHAANAIICVRPPWQLITINSRNEQQDLLSVLRSDARL